MGGVVKALNPFLWSHLHCWAHGIVNGFRPFMVLQDRSLPFNEIYFIIYLQNIRYIFSKVVELLF